VVVVRFAVTAEHDAAADAAFNTSSLCFHCASFGAEYNCVTDEITSSNSSDS